MSKSNDNPKPPERLELTAAMQIEAAADAGGDGPSAGSGQGKPRLPRFSMVAYTGGMMRIAGWRYPVVVDLAGLSIPSQWRPIRFGHDMSSGVGHTDSIAIAEGTLVAAGAVSRDTAAAREVVASAKNGFPWQASIGAAVEQSEFVREDQSVLVNGREFKGPLNVVRRATLGEISFVDLGVDGNTSVSVAASAKKESKTMEGDKSNTAAQDTEVQAQAAAGTEAGGPAIQASGDAWADPVPDIRAKALAETKRIEAVRKVCAGKHPEIEAKAIEEGWDATKTELEVLRAERPKPPAVHTPDTTVDGDVLAAAVCLTGGLPAEGIRCDAKVIDAAGRRFRSGIGLQELIMEAAWANGYAGRSFSSDMEGALRAAFSTFRLPWSYTQAMETLRH